MTGWGVFADAHSLRLDPRGQRALQAPVPRGRQAPGNLHCTAPTILATQPSQQKPSRPCVPGFPAWLLSCTGEISSVHLPSLSVGSPSHLKPATLVAFQPSDILGAALAPFPKPPHYPFSNPAPAAPTHTAAPSPSSAQLTPLSPPEQNPGWDIGA